MKHDQIILTFNWLTSTNPADTTENVEDNILNLSIEQSESEEAKAVVKILKPKDIKKWREAIQHAHYARIRACFQGEERDIFVGKLIDIELISNNEDFIIIKFESLNDQMEISEIIEKYGNFDVQKAIYPKSKLGAIDSALAHTTLAIHKNRCSSGFGISNMMTGERVINVGSNFYRDSLTFKHDDPITELNLILETEWLQKVVGHINIGKYVFDQCEGGVIKSLCHDYGKSWPKKGEYIATGYQVKNGFLYDVTNDEEAQIYGPFTYFQEAVNDKNARSLFMNGELKMVEMKSKYFKEKHFYGGLELGFKYRQKRTERVKVHLIQNVNEAFNLDGKTKTIKIKTQNIDESWVESIHDKEGVYCCSYSGGAFYSTEYGKQIVKHVLEIAGAQMQIGARVFYAQFTVPIVAENAEKLLDVDLNHEISITDGRLPNGELSGKVVWYRINAEQNKRWIDIRIASNVCESDENIAMYQDIHKHNARYVEPGYQDDEYCINSWICTDNGVHYLDFSEQIARDETADSNYFHMLLENVLYVDEDRGVLPTYENTAEQYQGEGFVFQSKDEMQDKLRLQTPIITMNLKSLRGKENITSQVDLVGYYISPKKAHEEND